ncbi:transcriptional regulator [filamentous cyanobacterium Phorm 46]|nr:transcriptional regulator [filamentous cyanobacterium Phorm 46]
MPEISRFLGIIITMYYKDHPLPHFHVRYNQQKAIIDIETLSILEGKLSPRILGLVIEWAAIHQTELMQNWQLARVESPLEPITPLE